MTTTIINEPKYTNEMLATALVASGGDIRLVKERINQQQPNTKVTEADIIEAFMSEASANINIQNGVKSLLLLNLLEILTEAKTHLISSLDEFSSGEILRTIQLVVEGVSKLLPPPPEAATPTQINLLQQFGGADARLRVEHQLKTYEDTPA